MSIGLNWFKNTSDTDVLSVSTLDYVGPHVWLKLRRHFSTLAEVLRATESKLLAAGLTAQQARFIIERPTNVAAAERLMASKNIKMVMLGQPTYPKLLKEINDPPLWLFYRGDLSVLERKCLTVVGTRKPTAYGVSAIKQLLCPELLADVSILSGLAYGVDKTAHSLSLEHSGRTAAVLAGGLDQIYPSDHTRLAESIIDGGGVLISEYPPLSRPKPFRFPVRNRILAGLAPLTIIIEATLKSGTLTTAKAALDYNRDLMALPGDITRANAEGPNFLIAHGAAPLLSSAQLEEYFQIKAGNKKTQLVDKQLAGTLKLLSDHAQTLDQLTAASGRPIDELLVDLTQLELLGLISQDHFGQYHKTKK